MPSAGHRSTCLSHVNPRQPCYDPVKQTWRRRQRARRFASRLVRGRAEAETQATQRAPLAWSDSGLSCPVASCRSSRWRNSNSRWCDTGHTFPRTCENQPGLWTTIAVGSLQPLPRGARLSMGRLAGEAASGGSGLGPGSARAGQLICSHPWCLLQKTGPGGPPVTRSFITHEAFSSTRSLQESTIPCVAGEVRGWVRVRALCGTGSWGAGRAPGRAAVQGACGTGLAGKAPTGCARITWAQGGRGDGLPVGPCPVCATVSRPQRAAATSLLFWWGWGEGSLKLQKRVVPRSRT